MIERFQKRGLASWGRIALAGVAAVVLMTGCGGGGNSTSSPQTVTLTGKLRDYLTYVAVPNETVSIDGTSLTGVSDANGNITIKSVPVGSVTLLFADSNGTSEPPARTYDLSKYSSNPRNIGDVPVERAEAPPPPN